MSLLSKEKVYSDLDLAKILFWSVIITVSAFATGALVGYLVDVWGKQ